MDAILKMASELGGLIAKHERYTTLRQVEDAAAKDATTAGLLKRYEEKRQEMAEAEAANKPIGPEQKHALQELTDQVHANERLQTLAKAQADYMELMNRVNAAIRRALDSESND